VDWRTILSIAGIILFVVVMMRGYGGMMGGGCGIEGGSGMGSRRRYGRARRFRSRSGWRWDGGQHQVRALEER